MTENGTFKKAVRARAARTGEKYTEARRHLLTETAERDATIEPHYRFTPPRRIEYVDANGRRDLPVPPEFGPAFSWGYAGSGPSTSSYALLLDATGDADWRLAMAFTSDNLDWWDEIGGQEFAITVAEVVAWRRENEQRVRIDAAANQGRTWSADEIREQLRDYLTNGPAGPLGPWWQVYRDRNGEPRLS